MADVLKENIGKAIGRIPSGCFVLTASDGERSTGILASWVQQASFEPPLVTVAVKKGRSIEALIDKSGHFVLNAISDNPLSMFSRFFKGYELDEPAFEGLDVEHKPAGVVIDGFDC